MPKKCPPLPAELRALGEDRGNGGFLSNDDEEALADFCAGVDLPEIEFSTWRDLHYSLDLVLTISLSRQEARQGGSREVKFVRTIRENSAEKRQKAPGTKKLKSKESASALISWPPQVLPGTVFTLVAQGDRRESHRGDVKITIRIS